MQIEVTSGELTAQNVDTIVVSLPEGTRRPGGAAGTLNAASGGAINAMIGSRAIRLSDGALTPIPVTGAIGARRAFVHGLGARDKLTVARARSQAGALARALRGVDAGSVAIAAQPDWLSSDLERGGQALAEGLTLGLYRFDQHHTREQDRPRGNVESIRIVEPSERRAARIRAGVERGQIMAEAQNLTRDLANSPANLMTPTDMAAKAQEIAEATGLECEIIEREEAERLGMGSYLSVAQGSQQPPKFIVLRYRGGRGRGSVGLNRQGHHVRLRRHLHQAGGGHGADEGRHERCRGRPGRDAGHRATRPCHQRDRHRPVYGEPAERQRHQARRRLLRDGRPVRGGDSTRTPRAGSCSPTRLATRERRTARR